MTSFEFAHRTRPAAPVAPASLPGAFRLWKAIRDNSLAAFPEAAYEQPLFSLDRPGSPLMVSDPAAIERICITNGANYTRGEFQQRRVRPLLGAGVLTAENEDWKAGRQAANPAFAPRMLKPWLTNVRSVTEQTANDWSRRPTGEPLDLFQAFLEMSFRIISKAAFSGDFDPVRKDIHRHVSDYIGALGRMDLPTLLQLPRWMPTIGGLRARGSISALRQIVDRVVRTRLEARRRGNVSAGDLLDRLLDADVDVDGINVSKAVFVRDNVLALLMAGHETTGSALTWIAYLLARFPWAAEQVAAEISDAALGADPAPEALNQLTFTRCVIDESLRLYPPVPILTRMAIAEDEVCRTTIRPGTEIVIAPWVVHRHRRLWADPDLFAPDRFRTRNRRTVHRAAYIPFGIGPRVCVGQSFAMHELLSVLSTLVPRFHFALPAGAVVEPLARITLQPRGGLPMHVTPR